MTTLPDLISAYTDAIGLAKAGKPSDAIRDLLSILEQRPEFTEARLALAEIMDSKGEEEEALERFD